MYLSLYFKQHRSEYYRLLDLVRHEGDWEAWVDFFLEGVLKTATHAVQTARALVELFERDESVVRDQGRPSITLLEVFRCFYKRVLASLPVICRETGLSFPTANKAVCRLSELGIIQEVTGHRRGRIYAYKRYLEILNRDLP